MNSKFIIGYGYSLPVYRNVNCYHNLECVKRTDKTVTFEFNDGEQIRRKIKYCNNLNGTITEYVVINGFKVAS